MNKKKNLNILKFPTNIAEAERQAELEAKRAELEAQKTALQQQIDELEAN